MCSLMNIVIGATFNSNCYLYIVVNRIMYRSFYHLDIFLNKDYCKLQSYFFDCLGVSLLDLVPDSFFTVCSLRNECFYVLNPDVLKRYVTLTAINRSFPSQKQTAVGMNNALFRSKL